jgi:hypothetical protein
MGLDRTSSYQVTSPSSRVHLHAALPHKPTAPGMTPTVRAVQGQTCRQDQSHHQGPPTSSLAVQLPCGFERAGRTPGGILVETSHDIGSWGGDRWPSGSGCGRSPTTRGTGCYGSCGVALGRWQGLRVLSIRMVRPVQTTRPRSGEHCCCCNGQGPQGGRQRPDIGPITRERRGPASRSHFRWRRVA